MAKYLTIGIWNPRKDIFRKIDAEALLEDIMAENFLYLITDIQLRLRSTTNSNRDKYK